MVETLVESQFLARIGALAAPPRNSDDAAPLDLRDLADDRAHRTGGCSHYHRLAGLGLPDVEESDVGGEPRHSEYAERVGRARDPRVDLHEVPPVRDSIVLPAHVCHHE